MPLYCYLFLYDCLFTHFSKSVTIFPFTTLLSFKNRDKPTTFFTWHIHLAIRTSLHDFNVISNFLLALVTRLTSCQS
jgi:hypothetical protein